MCGHEMEMDSAGLYLELLCIMVQKNMNKKYSLILKILLSGCTDIVVTNWVFGINIVINSLAFNITILLFISRLIFAVIWYLIALIHGDLEPDNLPQNQVIRNIVVQSKKCTHYKVKH